MARQGSRRESRIRGVRSSRKGVGRRVVAALAGVVEGVVVWWRRCCGVVVGGVVSDGVW